MVARNDSRTPTHWKITARRKARGPQQHRSQWQQQQQHLGRSQMQLSKGDELYPVQRLLWRTIGLSDSTKAAELQAADLESCLAAARTVCLKTAELQQLLCPQDIQRPLNPRNEAAALALLLANKQGVCGSSQQRQQQLQALLAAYPNTLQARTDSSHAAAAAQQQQQEVLAPQEFPAESPELVLYKWALEQGATSQVTPALFPSSSTAAASSSSSEATQSGSGGGAGATPSSPCDLRGCAAAATLEAGSVVMSVPAKLLITYQTAAESDFGKALSSLPGLDPETLAVIWTMVDRQEPESPHAPFWAALPAHFGSALSAPQPQLDLLKGVPLFQECVSARAHVRQQFEALQQTFKVLLTAYSSYLQPSWFGEEAYLWAVELWYAYAIQVKFPDSTIKPALVPLASLINHSAAPHIVHFSTVNPKTRSLELKSFSPVHQHQQVFLSYGPLPNSQLLLFYGFALPDNPFEQQDLQVQPERVLKLLQQHKQQAAQQQEKEGDKQLWAAKLELLQALQLPASFTLTVQQPLPHGLLHALRLLCADSAQVLQLQQAMNQGTASAASTAQAAPGGSMRQQGNSSSSSKKTTPALNSGGGNAASVEASEQRWAAVAQQAAVLGSPLSSRNEAAALAVLQGVVLAARQPYAACLAKLHKRQQLQAMLQGRGQQVQPAEAGLMGVLEVYLCGVLGLFDACTAAALQTK